MNKFYFVFDKTKKANIVKKILLKKFKNHPPSLANIIIIAGGDGFMLHSLKKYYNFEKP